MSEASSSTSTDPPSSGRWGRWGRSAFDKSIKLSDWASGYANAGAAKMGAERFWPRSNDTEEEIAKCERILRTFTVEGITSKDEKEEEVADGKGNIITKKRKVVKKIPPAAIRNAKGIVIYTAMRSGIAPFGGTGGTGLMLARLPDGSWSAPTSVSPNNVAVGLLLGFDVFNVILLLNTDKAVESFHTLAKVTMGAEMAVAAGPLGTGTSAESGVDRAPIYSYVQSRGLYAGVEAIAQAFLCRFDENERFYYWPGIQSKDILTGKVHIPPSVYPLHRALRDAETGAAQGGKLERTVYDVVKVPASEVISRINDYKPPPRARSQLSGKDGEETVEGQDGAASHEVEGETDADYDEEMLHDGERLRLPPTPAELEALEAAGIPDEEDLRLEALDRAAVYQLAPPPMHHRVKLHWDQHPNKRRLRPTRQLVQGGVWGARAREEPANVPLPPSPWEVPLPPSPEIEAALEEEDEAGGGAKATWLPPPMRSATTSTTRAAESPTPSANGSSKRSSFLPPPRRQDGKGAGKSGEQTGGDEVTSHVRDPSTSSSVPVEEGMSSVDSTAASMATAAEEEKGEIPVAQNVESEAQADAIFEEAAGGQGEEEGGGAGGRAPAIAESSAPQDWEPKAELEFAAAAGVDEQAQAQAEPVMKEETDEAVTKEEETKADEKAEEAAVDSAGVSRTSSIKSGILPPPPRRPPRARGGPAAKSAGAGAAEGGEGQAAASANSHEA